MSVNNWAHLEDNMLQTLINSTNFLSSNKLILQKFYPAICSAINSKSIHTTTPVTCSKGKGHKEEKEKKLPKYPLPSLKETLDKYLKSVKPLLKEKELEKTCKVVEEFGKAGGCGEKLQNLLKERAKKLDNWLECWWLNTAYLGYRASVVINSSPGLVFPFQCFQTREDMYKYTAKLIIAAMMYKADIDEDKIPLEKMGKDPLDMSQYKKIFGTCRIPAPCADKLEYNPTSCHIVIAYRNHFFKLPVSKCSSVQHIVCELGKIESKVNTIAEPVGILTSDERDIWAQSYELLMKDPCNCKAVKEIQKSLFLVCLDEKIHDVCNNRLTIAGRQTIHGEGSRLNGGNRWFDKTVQFIVSCDGINGLTYEHSPSEGQPIAVMTDFIVNKIAKMEETCSPGGECGAEELKFNVDECLRKAICESKSNLDKMVQDFELKCGLFECYGKNFIKAQKMSPDSYIQMAMQYSYYRLHNKPAAHYESAAARKFIGGRTETIRSCSVESVAFAKAMLDKCKTDAERKKLMVDAVNAHKKYTVDALNAKGVDRHLLGLKLIARENNIPLPAIFEDCAFKRSTTFKLSTSQVATKCPGFMCYGAVTKDGYGICYNPRDDDIYYGIGTFKRSKETNATLMMEMFEKCLKDMQIVLMKTQPAKL